MLPRHGTGLEKAASRRRPGERSPSFVAGRALRSLRRRAVATIDFHVTSECSQECAYCWGPQGTLRRYGPSLDVTDLDALVARTDFGAPKHAVHSSGWSR